MKKSKLLIPAIAFLVVSMAAAATSTVAWFTANTATTVTLNNVIAASAEGSLYVDWATAANTYGITTANTYNADPQAVTTQSASLSLNTLRDASIALGATSTAYYADKTSAGAIDPGKYTAVSADTSKDPGSAYYYYAKFELKFIIHATDQTQKFHIFMDKGSSLTLPTGDEGSKHIYSAVRVGMVKSDNSTAVWAPKYDATSDYDSVTTGTQTNETAALTYVSSATATSTYAYAAACDATNAGFTSFPATDAFANTTYKNYIGEATSATPITCTFFVWFEGEDKFCNVSEIQSAAYTLALHFSAVRQNA